MSDSSIRRRCSIRIVAVAGLLPIIRRSSSCPVVLKTLRHPGRAVVCLQYVRY